MNRDSYWMVPNHLGYSICLPVDRNAHEFNVLEYRAPLRVWTGSTHGWVLAICDLFCFHFWSKIHVFAKVIAK
jgi:hypothetical protein